jgi:phosphatidylserine decarboxylase
MITKYGFPQALIFPCLVLVIMAGVFLAFYAAGLPLPILIVIEALLFLVFLWMFSFFRDPPRKIVYDESILYSPCDGTVTDIVREDGAVRVSVFLSIFNVHLNRVPCSVTINEVSYKKGQFRDARDPDSYRVNESNTVTMTRTAEPKAVLTVKQVSGAIARHIVCKAKAGDTYKQGGRFGMIKFGSRTDLCAPDSDGLTVTVKTGDKVKAGLTPIAVYKR